MPVSTASVYQNGISPGTYEFPPAFIADIQRAVMDRNGRTKGDEVRFQCPYPTAHKNDDANPSARYNMAKKTWTCDVCGAGGGALGLADLLGIPKPSTSDPIPMPKRHIVSTYDYRRAGKLVFQVVRYEPKDFRQRRPNGSGGWVYNLQGVEPILYQLDDIQTAAPSEWVHLCAGEKDADRLRFLGKIATTAPMGEGKWRPSYSDALRGRKVAIYVDNDDAGQRHAQRLVPLLAKDCRAVKVVELPDLPDKGDVSDWLDAGHTAEDLDAFFDSLPKWSPEGSSFDEPSASPRYPATITAAELMRKTFPEPRWAVPGLFAEGLTLLVDSAKIGKSWLSLNVGTSVACGGRAVGRIEVDEGRVLYLALEDTERRLHERLAITLQGGAPPEWLEFRTEWPGLNEGGADAIDSWLEDHPDARLVIVDTFQRFRGPVSGNQNLYAADYNAIGELKRVADRHGVGIVCVHHDRKMDAPDPFDTVSGTTGLVAAADTTCVLKREIGRADAVLYVRGRDVPEAEHALNFDAASCTWNLMGDAEAFRRSPERQAVITLLTASPEPMGPKAIANALGKGDEKGYAAMRRLLPKMVEDGQILGAQGKYAAIQPANISEVP